MSLSINKEKELLRLMYLARFFDDKVYELFHEKDEGYGTTHLSTGQEAIAAGVMYAVEPGDKMMTNHRGHAHTICSGASPERMMCEMLGKSDGFCLGLGGSLHIVDKETGGLFANGVVGPVLPMSAGAALALKMDKKNRVCICFFGDGTSNSGMFHEALNMTALWKLPVIYICENNLYGMSTPVSKSTAGGAVAPRGAAYGIPSCEIDGNDVLAVYAAAADAIRRARAGEGATLIEAHTYRYRGHSKSDRLTYRTREEESAEHKNDPIDRFVRYLSSKIDESELSLIRDKAQGEIENAAKAALSAPWPTFEQAERLVYAGGKYE